MHYVQKQAGQCGIIYCTSRKRTEEVADLLKVRNYRAACYHAGLPGEQRAAVQMRSSAMISILWSLPWRLVWGSINPTYALWCITIFRKHRSLLSGNRSRGS